VPKTYTGEKTDSSTNDVGKIGYLHVRIETRSLSLTLYKNQFKMDKDPNVRLETLKLLQENIEKILKNIGNNFLNITPIAQEIRAKIKWNLHQIACISEHHDNHEDWLIAPSELGI
jgi:hypothetical protein